LWLVLGAVAAVAVLAAGAFVLVGGDDSASDDEPAGRSPTSAPESTASPATEPEGDGEQRAELLQPVAATRAYFEAVAAGDCAYMIDHSTPASWSSEGQSREEALAECRTDVAGSTGLEGLTVADVTLVSQSGDTAVVRVDVSLAGQTESRELPVRHVDGEWLVDLAGADRGGFGATG
jgi:hypothetical protein